MSTVIVQNIAEQVASDIDSKISKRLIAVSSKILALEFVINNYLPTVQQVSIHSFTVDFIDGSLIVLKDSYNQPWQFYTQTQAGRY